MAEVLKEVKCPAGAKVIGIVPEKSGCYCKIEELVIELSSPSLLAHCGDRYTLCPTWRNHKQSEWRDKEHWVKQRRKEQIEKQHGETDEAADAFVAGTADIDELLG